MAKKILTQGIVQGVGFRPYIYRLAKDLNLNGYVRNLGNVVEIILEGDNIDLFIDRLPKELPPIAKIDSMKTEDIAREGFDDFTIIESSDEFSGVSVIPPDIAICDSCLEEYGEPLNRRYHGEAICCSDCGPQMKIYKGPEEINSNNPIKVAADKLKEGKIIAIKGIGGTHLVVDAYNDKAVKELRKRLNRPNQAFAVMSKDLDSVKGYAKLSKKEIATITSNKRPIVVLKKNDNYNFPESLAPGLHNIGVMLPYSPMHYLLFDEGDIDTYVMTSANTPGEPMMITNKEILNLNGISDYSLIHNRKILNRCDDSVIRFRNDTLSFIRRSRGYTPEPYKINYDVNDLNVLALGPELDVTFAMAKDHMIYPSQHIGNTN